MSRTCPFCSSSEIDEDPSRADVVCMSCGAVLEESAIVSEVQFQERAGGHDVIGQFVSRERAQQTTIAGVPNLGRTESRELTFQKGRKAIQEIASQLRINQFCVDTAFNFFKMCVSRNFTRGRPRTYVVASCLYISCRLEHTPHLLLDFSDVTQVNVYELGRTLSLLTRLLKISLPQTDPCLYILRFAVILEFGEKQKDVVTLATRIVQRMKRDWMATGRRPTGLCGAALLLASRAHGFNRTINDVVRVVHISDTVIRRRLDEFASTPSGGLTIEEFHNVDLEQSEDPPAFREARRKAREEKRRREEMEAELASKEVAPVQKEIESALRAKLKKSSYGRMICPVVGEDDIQELRSGAGELLRGEIIDTVLDYAEEEDEGISAMETMRRRHGPTLDSLGISKGFSFAPSSSSSSAAIEEEILDNDAFNDIDDDEIDSYILSKSEVELKSRIWMKHNGTHLEEMARKRKERAEEEERRKNDPKRRRNNKKKDKEGENGEPVKKKPAKSSKINYEALAELEGPAEEILGSEKRHAHMK